jgi:hypothetical protein
MGDFFVAQIAGLQSLNLVDTSKCHARSILLQSSTNFREAAWSVGDKGRIWGQKVER